MKLETTYPPVSKRNFQRRRLLDILKWPFLLAAYICPVVNLATGGPAWSIASVTAIYMVWTLVFSIDLVEYNRISQFIKLIIWATILMAMIEVFIAPGWAIGVMPIVWFSALAMSDILFFTDFARQKQNMLPMLLFILLSIIGAALGLSLANGRAAWAYIVMGALALVSLAACVISLGPDFFRELRRRFHIR